MEVLIKTLVITTFLIILGFSAINFIANALIFWSSRKKIYLKITLFWAFLIINFIIQANAQNGENIIINGFGFTMLPLGLLSYASLAFTPYKFPAKTFITMLLTSIVGTQYLLTTQMSFTVKALPFATVAALPLIYTSYIYLVKHRAKITGLMTMHAVVLILLAFHSFNFAFFRMEPEAQLWGWPVAYAIYQLLAGLIPALTIDFFHREEESRLIHIIDEKTSNLRKTNGNLVEAIEQKNYLFRTLTHDISTPLTIARMKIDLQERAAVPSELFVRNMSDVISMMEELVKKVQIFASVEAQGIKLETDEIELLSCVKSVEKLFHERLENKKIKFNYDSDNLRQCYINVDRESFINSVLTNIISNAVKFSYEGGIIDFYLNSSDEGFVSLSIKDHGIGMPSWLKENLFDFQAKTSRPGTQDEKGTGFGMPIIAKIIQFYGGKVFVNSCEKTDKNPESYTEFQLILRGRLDYAAQAA